MHIFHDSAFSGQLKWFDRSKHPVWSSMVFVAMESVFVIAFDFVHRFIKWRLSARQLGMFYNIVTDDDDLIAHNRYKDASLPFRKCAVVFLLQLGMLVFFFEELDQSDDLMKRGKVSLSRWLLAVLVVYHCKDDELGGAFRIRYWIELVYAIRAKWGNENLGKPYWLIPEVIARLVMSFFVNGLGLHFMRRTVPIFLCVKGHFDFATSAMGVFFIVGLDALADQSATVVDNAKDRKQIGVIPGHKSIDDVVNCLFNDVTAADEKGPPTGDGGKETETDLKQGDENERDTEAPLLASETGQGRGDRDPPESAVE